MPPRISQASASHASAIHRQQKQEYLAAVNEERNQAIVSRMVIVSQLENTPNEVTETQLETVRENLATALKKLEKVSEEIMPNRLAETWLALAEVYEVSIQRDVKSRPEKLNCDCDGPTAYVEAKKIGDTLEMVKPQIHAIENADKYCKAARLKHKKSLAATSTAAERVYLMGTQDFTKNEDLKKVLTDKLNNALATYFISACQQFFMIKNLLTESQNSNAWEPTPNDQEFEGLQFGEEVTQYLQPLDQRIREITQKLNALIENTPKDSLKNKGGRILNPLFKPYTREMKNLALGLSNVLFAAIDELKTTATGEAQLSALEMYNDICDSTLHLVDISDKMIQLGFSEKGKRKTRESNSIEDLPSISTLKLSDGKSMDKTPESFLEDFSPRSFASSNASSSSTNKSEHALARVQRLLEKKPCAQFKLFYEQRHIFHPDAILNVASSAKLETEKVLKPLEKHLKTGDADNSPFSNIIQGKLTELKEDLQRVSDESLKANLYKSYRFPQAEHWLSLFQENQIQQIEPAKKLNSDRETLFEIKITPKPCTDGGKAEPVFLHLHLAKAPEKTKGQTLLQTLIIKPDLLKAAHLKSTYYRNKGKEWQANNMAQGRHEELVKRSPVGTEFLQAMVDFQQGQIPQKSGRNTPHRR